MELYQFHQLSVWATVQNTLDFFESGVGLGRRISWAFEGNRLIVVPHAGYGENAYYDRASKSLQFYWFDDDEGHASTPACRPTSSTTNSATPCSTACGRITTSRSARETAAFHEFVGDLTAILMAFRNNAFRKVVLKESHGNLTNASCSPDLAQRVRRGGHRRPVPAQRPEQRDDEEARRQSRTACLVRSADRRDVRHPHGGLRQAPEATRSSAAKAGRQQASRATGGAGRHRSPDADARHPAARSAAALLGDVPRLRARRASHRTGRQPDRSEGYRAADDRLSSSSAAS